jgi:16S rRNA (guanine(966)-N(2))-methyltransferase RsmD
MRIIAGEFRGRTLLAPQTDQTRPITDRVKQSVFDVLMPYVADAVVYDVFAGTGSLGLESISRGCKSAVFFESDPSALALLGKNIAALKVESRAKIVRGDLFRWFASERTGVAQADILFLDPPYRFLNDRPSELKTLAENITSKYLSPTGQIIFRHDLRDSLELPNLRAFDVRDYGSMRVELLMPTASSQLPGAGVP